MSDLIRGNQLLRSGKLEEAVAAYQSAIAHNPSFHWSHYKLGEALEKLGRWEDAIANYKTAIKINPNSALFQSSGDEISPYKTFGYPYLTSIIYV
ncbi:tetratricopeptide repeat protein [Tychonema bourrellyi]|uniref:tetratricopeptide repeat protein n=1 Tax=Tychonema bourrellyi TaxID=54313 RepID=UPI0015D512AB